MDNLNEIAALLAERAELTNQSGPQTLMAWACSQQRLEGIEQKLLEAMPALFEALRWRSIEDEQPPLDPRRIDASVDVQVKWIVPHTDRWSHGVAAWLIDVKTWASVVPWTHWRPVDIDPQPPQEPT